nr:hypothetical protein [uncultured Carboxylicivirga sp.]
MKKHLKKIVLMSSFVAMAAAANADVFHIKCNNGKEYNYISLEPVGSDAEAADFEQAIEDLCS